MCVVSSVRVVFMLCVLSVCLFVFLDVVHVWMIAGFD